MRHALLALLACAAFAGCRTIPLDGDPNVAQHNRAKPAAAIVDVDWWKRLVTVGLLEFNPAETATPAVDPDTERVIVGTRDGEIRSLSPVDGHIEWAVKTGARINAGAAVQDGIVYVGGGDGKLYALRSLTGEKVWTYDAGEELMTQPTVTDSLVLVTSQSETVFAVDRKTGEWKWQYRRDAPSGFSLRGAAQPTVWGDEVLTGFADGSLVSLGLSDGVARWERNLSPSGGDQFLDVDTKPVVDEQGHVYAASYKDGIYGLDAKTGDTLWSSQRTGITSLVLRGNVLFATGDGTVTAVETGEGRVLWTVDLSDKSSSGKGNNAGSAPMLAHGYLIVPTSTTLAFLDSSTGRVRAVWNPGRGVTATPALVASPRLGNRLYVISNLGSLFALQLVGSGG